MITLFKEYLEESLRDFRDDDIKVRFIGDTTRFPKSLQELIAETWELCENRTGMVLNIAMNYGGRAEIVRAARALAEKAKAGLLSPGEIDEAAFAGELYTAGQPDRT